MTLTQDVLQLIVVTGGFVCLLAGPCLLLSYALTIEKEWPYVVLNAIILGCGIQATFGIIWSHIIGDMPFFEVLLFFSFCILLSLSVKYFSLSQSRVKTDSNWCIGNIILPAILLIAFLIRSIHPLETYALGQSDNYTHLHYLHYIVSQGHLENVVYPPGYHWLLALPVLVFQLDPYLVARFGGAFFGTILVLAIYVFLDKVFDRRSAIFGSLCAACFPGMILLMKTGVGSFANQFGLFLVPCLLYLYSQTISQTKNLLGYQVFFLAACLGFAASVPMMMIHVFIIISIERFFSVFKEHKYWFRQSALVIVLCIPAVLLVTYHFSQASPRQKFKTAEVLMAYGGEEKETTKKIIAKVDRVGERYIYSTTGLARIIVNSPYFHLLVDLFTVKRLGFSNLYLNLIGGTLFFMFLSCLGYGLYQGRTGFLLLGIWGGLTTIQAGTGFLQFSSYQREGWSLLIATSCLSGVITGGIYERLGQYRLARVTTAILVAISIWWTVQHPPRHPVIRSSAEDDIIRSVRFLGRDRSTVLTECENRIKSPSCGVAQLLVPEFPLTIVTRRFIGWLNQGEIVPNVMPPNSLTKSRAVSTQPSREVFLHGRQYVVLIDRKKHMRPSDITSAFAMVAPSQVAATLRQQKFLYRANFTILKIIDSLPKNEWQVIKQKLSDSLTAYIVTPQRTQLKM